MLRITLVITMIKFCFLSILTATVIIYPVNGFAYRPFVTEDAGVAGKGVAQFEASWDYLEWDSGDVENVLVFVPIYGVTERIEISTEVPYLFHNPEEGNDEDGIGDINIVGKVLIINETERLPAFTMKGVIKTSSGNSARGLGSGDQDYSIVAVASKCFGAVALHAMLGYTFVGDSGDEDIRNIYLYGIAGDYKLTERFHIVTEVNGNRHPDREVDNDPLSGLLGITYSISSKIILDCGIRIGFNDSAPKQDYLAGVSITF